MPHNFLIILPFGAFLFFFYLSLKTHYPYFTFLCLFLPFVNIIVIPHLTWHNPSRFHFLSCIFQILIRISRSSMNVHSSYSSLVHPLRQDALPSLLLRASFLLWPHFFLLFHTRSFFLSPARLRLTLGPCINCLGESA